MVRSNRNQHSGISGSMTDLAHSARGTVGMAGEVMHQIKGGARSAVEHGIEKTRSMKAGVEHRIAERPWAAIGIATGVGVLLGLAMWGMVGRKQ